MTHAPDWLGFFERTYPSANMALIRGESAVLVDTGYSSDLTDTENLLREAGVPPESLSLIVNTHYHSDHVGVTAGCKNGTARPSPPIGGRPPSSTTGIGKPAAPSGWDNPSSPTR